MGRCRRAAPAPGRRGSYSVRVHTPRAEAGAQLLREFGRPTRPVRSSGRGVCPSETTAETDQLDWAGWVVK